MNVFFSGFFPEITGSFAGLPPEDRRNRSGFVKPRTSRQTDRSRRRRVRLRPLASAPQAGDRRASKRFGQAHSDFDKQKKQNNFTTES